MKHDDERAPLDRNERDFVERLADHYQPPPWTPAERAEFDAALRARIEGPRRRWPLPALATLAAAGLAWIGFAALRDGKGPEPAAASVWESELFLSSDVSPRGDLDESEGLPEDYVAIASLFMDG